MTFRISTGMHPMYIEGLMQERCNSIANALELRLSYTNPSISRTLRYEMEGRLHACEYILIVTSTIKPGC